MAKGYIVSIHTKIIDEEKLKLYGVHAKSALEANAGECGKRFKHFKT